MPQVTLARMAGGRVKRAVIKTGRGGKAVAYAEERHAAGGTRSGSGERRTGGDGDVWMSGEDGGGGE